MASVALNTLTNRVKKPVIPGIPTALSGILRVPVTRRVRFSGHDVPPGTACGTYPAPALDTQRAPGIWRRIPDLQECR